MNWPAGTRDIRPAINALAQAVEGIRARRGPVAKALTIQALTIRVTQDWAVPYGWLIDCVAGVLDRHTPGENGTCVGCAKPWPCPDVIGIATELDLNALLGVDPDGKPEPDAAEPVPGEIRVGPGGDILAWYWPESDTDQRPWLTLARPLDEDIEPDWEWMHRDDAAGWPRIGFTTPQALKTVVPGVAALPRPGT